jgi:hypothetical protein
MWDSCFRHNSRAKMSNFDLVQYAYYVICQGHHSKKLRLWKPIDDWGCATGEGSLCLGLGFKPIDDWGCSTGEGSLCLGLGFKPINHQ